MVRKIKREEYLKGYETMSDGERKGYLSRVGEWLADGGRRLMELTERPMAKSQNIVLLSARWKEPEVVAFAEGARLLSALVGVAETWLPTQLYVKSAYRAVRQMTALLGDVLGFRLQVSGGGTPPLAPPLKGAGSGYTNGGTAVTRGTGKTSERAKAVAEGRAPMQPFGDYRKVGEMPAGEPQGTLPAGETAGTAAAAAPSIAGMAGGGSGSVPVRPRHIDQYVHLLPEGTQKRAAAYGELMREFDVSREKLRLVMEDVHASDKDREQWAKKVAKLDGQIGDIRKELDREWEKVAASGRVVMDDLGMAHLVNPTPDPSPKERGVAGAQTGDLFGVKPEAMKPETAVADDNQRKAALLRKWLIDTRYGNKGAEKRAKYQEKWREKYLEMVRLGGMEAVTEKVREAAKHYEIDLEALSSTTNETN